MKINGHTISMVMMNKHTILPNCYLRQKIEIQEQINVMPGDVFKMVSEKKLTDTYKEINKSSIKFIRIYVKKNLIFMRFIFSENL